MVASFGAFLAFLDSTIVNIAFPDIQRSFPTYDLGALSWILNGYNIVFAAFPVAAGTLYRAYLLKEQLREVFRIKGNYGRQLLAGWLSWASHSRIPEFVALARSIRRHRDLICNTLDHGLSNARSEATNTHLRALRCAQTSWSANPRKRHKSRNI
ncbi:hypothetical protein A4G26_17025 [Mycobacterium kansasii]|uniref:Multidrug resistance protein Stp n=1 Tax=Mycobacterium innocens TaxID=2341083 RepID=A0A498PTY6_9MYCO|nr:hypothetical protein A4G26_17025 [Mycobacterium kansasii]VBA36411.1 Multidrug resistance protein Stp [Mycobacterium innocens]